MRQGRPLRRRKPLRARSEKQQARVETATKAVRRDGKAFREAIKGERCIVCGRSEREAYDLTGWGHEAHHAIGKSKLKRMHLLELLWDPGNAVATCAEPCHRRHTNHTRRIRRSELPARVVEFASSQPDLKLAFDFEYPE